MNEFFIDEPAKWKTRKLRQIHTADPVGMGRKSRQYNIFHYIVQARPSVHTDWIRCVYLAPFPLLPFCGLIYTLYNAFIYSTMTGTGTINPGSLEKSVIIVINRMLMQMWVSFAAVPPRLSFAAPAFS